MAIITDTIVESQYVTTETATRPFSINTVAFQNRILVPLNTQIDQIDFFVIQPLGFPPTREYWI
jgi:hypothetical protein